MGCGSSSPAFKATKVTMTPEIKTAMKENGWDTGIVAFGNLASESCCTVAIALSIAKKDVRWVSMTFDDQAPQDMPEDYDENFKCPNSNQVIGVKDPTYSLICGGVPLMPAVAIDGQMYLESTEIIRMLADMTFAPQKVKDLIDAAIKFNKVFLETVKHWGWAAMHAGNNYAMVNKENYTDFGKGNKDEEWERRSTNLVKAFLENLEVELDKKPEINGYFVGNTLTMADAALFNVVQSLELIAGLKVKDHYPKLYANWEMLKATEPENSKQYLTAFPYFAQMCSQANKEPRANGFDINNYWSRETFDNVLKKSEEAREVGQEQDVADDSDEDEIDC